MRLVGHLTAQWQLCLPAPSRHDQHAEGLSVVHAPYVPRYTEMIGYTLDKLGWDSKRFDVYRVRMQFPIIPTSVLVTYELPEAPTE